MQDVHERRMEHVRECMQLGYYGMAHFRPITIDLIMSSIFNPATTGITSNLPYRAPDSRFESYRKNLLPKGLKVTVLHESRGDSGTASRPTEGAVALDNHRSAPISLLQKLRGEYAITWNGYCLGSAHRLCCATRKGRSHQEKEWQGKDFFHLLSFFCVTHRAVYSMPQPRLARRGYYWGFPGLQAEASLVVKVFGDMLVLILDRAALGDGQLGCVPHKKLRDKLVRVNPRLGPVCTFVQENFTVRIFGICFDDCGSVQVDHGRTRIFDQCLQSVHALEISQEVDYAFCDSGVHAELSSTCCRQAVGRTRRFSSGLGPVAQGRDGILN